MEISKTTKLLILGGSALSLGLIFYKCLHSGPRAKTVMLELLDVGTLNDYFYLIRRRYSKQVKRFIQQSRKERRSLQLGSEAYANSVKIYHAQLQVLLRKASEEVLQELKCQWKVYEDSTKLYKYEQQVADALQELKVPINKGGIQPSLTVNVLRDILEFYRVSLENENPLQTSSQMPLILYIIEDQIFSKFGFEIEEIERGFDRYWEDLKGYEILVNSIRDGKLIEDVLNQIQEFLGQQFGVSVLQYGGMQLN